MKLKFTTMYAHEWTQIKDGPVPGSRAQACGMVSLFNIFRSMVTFQKQYLRVAKVWHCQMILCNNYWFALI